LSTRETEAIETPARLATSYMVSGPLGLFASGKKGASFVNPTTAGSVSAYR
jgi:hypothetical protein